jgi:hypothetical protein
MFFSPVKTALKAARILLPTALLIVNVFAEKSYTVKRHTLAPRFALETDLRHRLEKRVAKLLRTGNGHNAVQNVRIEILEGIEALDLDARVHPIASALLPLCIAQAKTAVNVAPGIGNDLNKHLKTRADNFAFFEMLSLLLETPGFVFKAISSEGPSGGSMSFDIGKLVFDESRLIESAVAAESCTRSGSREWIRTLRAASEPEQREMLEAIGWQMVEFAADPIEITNGVANGLERLKNPENRNVVGRSNVAFAVVRNFAVEAPDKDESYYAYYASRAANDHTHLLNRLSTNLHLTAGALDKPVSELTIGMLYRERLDGAIREIVLSGVDLGPGEAELMETARLLRNELVRHGIYIENAGLLNNDDFERILADDPEIPFPVKTAFKIFETEFRRFIGGLRREIRDPSGAQVFSRGNLVLVKDGEANFPYSLVRKNLDVNMGCGGPAERMTALVVHALSGMHSITAIPISKANTQPPKDGLDYRVGEIAFHDLGTVPFSKKETRHVEAKNKLLRMLGRIKENAPEPTIREWVFGSRDIIPQTEPDGIGSMTSILSTDPHNVRDVELDGIVPDLENRTLSSDIALVTPRGLARVRLVLEYPKNLPEHLFYTLAGRPDLALEHLDGLAQAVREPVEILLENMNRLSVETKGQYESDLTVRDGILHQILDSVDQLALLQKKNPENGFDPLIDIGIVTLDALVELLKDYRLLYSAETGWDYLTALVRLYRLTDGRPDALYHSVREQTLSRIRELLNDDDLRVSDALVEYSPADLRPLLADHPSRVAA